MAHKTEWLTLKEIAIANAEPNEVPWIKTSFVTYISVALNLNSYKYFISHAQIFNVGRCQNSLKMSL